MQGQQGKEKRKKLRINKIEMLGNRKEKNGDKIMKC
jgi:hypothetical protein